MSPTDPPTDLCPLAGDLERLTRRVDELPPAGRVGEIDGSLRELWGLVRAMADRLNAGPEEKPTPPVRAWLHMAGSGDRDQAVEVLTDLVGWLDEVYLRYPGVTLPACWMFHPWVVEELLWLRQSHADAYAARMWGVPAGMWHDQQRPRVVERIRQHLSSCDLKQHVSPGRAARPPLPAPLAGHVTAVAEAWTSHGLPPEPTSEQLEDAHAYDDERLKRA